jgi:hypothetical protein
MANQIVLAFAGEGQDLMGTFDQVGKGSEQMAERTRQSTERMAEGFDHASSQSSLLSGGIGDIGGALTEAFGEETAIGQFGAKMEAASAIVTGFTGVMDLGIFATNNLKLAQAKQAIQTGITSGVTKAAAAAQWLMNTALLASPVTWIVLAIIALIAVIVLIATKTDWFSKAWRASWKWIKDAAGNTWEFLKKIPGWIGSAFSKVADFITRPYRAAFNAIARAWNGTIGRLSWTVPGWVPGIGGNSISVPHLPTFHSGGVIPGIRGTAVPFMGLAGERVSSLASSGSSGGTLVVADGPVLGALVEAIASEVRGRGGQLDQLGLRLPKGALS